MSKKHLQATQQNYGIMQMVHHTDIKEIKEQGQKKEKLRVCNGNEKHNNSY